tara:strand:+ start:226 stop:489 length:264 start_codon:yes stop_codon:yes gene_type:complete
MKIRDCINSKELLFLGFEKDILEYLTFVTIKKEDVMIRGKSNLGSEYCGATNLTLSTYIIREHIKIALNVVGRPLKYDNPSLSETLN